MNKIKNIDNNECFKWSLVKFLNSADPNPARITKVDKEFAKMLGFKGTKFPVKIRDIHEIEKNNSINVSVFSYENKEKHAIYVPKKCCEEKYVDLLLIGKEGKRHYVFIKDFNIFMYDHTLYCGKKHSCRYCLQTFSTEEILKCHFKDCFKIKRLQCLKKVSMLSHCL